MAVTETEEKSASCLLKPGTTAVSSRTPVLETAAGVVDAESDKRITNTQVIEMSDDQNNIAATAEQKDVSPKEDMTYNDLCYFCKNGLFCCNHIMSCVSTIKNNRGESKFDGNLDLFFLNNVSAADMNDFDLTQLLSPLDHNIYISVDEGKLSSGDDSELANQVNYQKYEVDTKLNFNLDFSVFEQCLFGEDMLPENSTGNFKSEVAVSKVCGHDVNVNATDPDNIPRNPTFLEAESPVQPEREIKPIQESFSIVSSSRFSNTEHTPVRNRQTETNSSYQETPSNLLISPVSPIFGSVLKKRAPESPVLGCIPKNISQNSTRMVPVCSTPKVHKKTLFSRNVLLDTVQQEESVFILGSAQHSKVTRDGCVNTFMVRSPQQQLKSPSAEVQVLPRPNFDLFSAVQDIGKLELGAENVRNSDSATNSTMYTVTQMLGLVDKDLNTRGVESVKSCRSVQDIVPRTFSESHIAEDNSRKGDMCSGSANQGSRSNIPSLVTNSTKMVTSLSRSSLAGQKIPVDYKQKPKQTHGYLHDSDDDIFVGLAVDHAVSTTSKQRTSVTPEVPTVHDIVAVEPNLLGNRDRSEHEIWDGDVGKQDFDTEFPSFIPAAPQVMKISEYSTFSHRQLPSAASRPSRSLSLRRKIKDSAKNACIENSLKAIGRESNVSSLDSKARNSDKDIHYRIIGDANQFAELSLSVTEKQKEISRYIGFEDQLDRCISLDNQKTVPCGSSVANICKDPSSDESLIVKPHVKNRKINISSASNESRHLSPERTQGKLRRHEGLKENTSLPLEDSVWLTARKNNVSTSPSSVTSSSPRRSSDVKKPKSFNGNKSVDTCVPAKRNDTEISSEDDSYFQSQSIRRLKRINQRKSADKTGRSKRHKKGNPVNKKLKVRCMLGSLYLESVNINIPFTYLQCS
jgi:hypothetical protein